LLLAFYPQIWDTQLVSKTISPLPIKPLRWIGPSKEELMEFPDPVVKEMGHALHVAQTGSKADNAKPLHGFGGAGVLEIVEDYDGDTFRAVYTVKLAGTVYVLHCFQKKSKRGSETPKQTISLIKQRLKTATETHERQKRSENHEEKN
jgi:phage-related protein